VETVLAVLKTLKTLKALKTLKTPRPLSHFLKLFSVSECLLKKVFLSIFCALNTPALVAATPLQRIVIDPGHGGTDCGAFYHNLKEKNLTLQIARQLRKELVKKGWIVFLTRNSDYNLSLSKRARLSRDFRGQLFLSIHVNSSENHQIQGMEVYFQNQLPPDEESMFQAKRENDNLNPQEELKWPLRPIPEASHLRGDLLNILQDLQRNHRINSSSRLAKHIAQAWTGQKRPTENIIHQAPFYVVSNVNMPSALVEIGFLSNKVEAHRLSSTQYQKNIVSNLVKGLSRFKEMVDKTINPSLN